MQIITRKSFIRVIFFLSLLFHIGMNLECKSQEYKKENTALTQNTLHEVLYLQEKARTVNEEIFSKQDFSDARNLTVKDLLNQFKLKKEEYCSEKINDLDDFPVDPTNMCCNLNFMNVDPKKGKIHYGFDIPLVTGTPLRCPDKENCLVVRVYPEWYTYNGMPRQTIYGHSLLVYFKKAGYFGFYAHLKKINASQGRIFRYKEIMAYSGNTGSLTTGPHLHFTLFRNQDCLNGVFDEKMRLAVLNTIEEIKLFEAKEKGLEPSEYNIEDRNATEVLRRCKVKLSQEANRACIARNFHRDFIDPLEVTSDNTIQKLILEINPKRMRDHDILKLFSYHQKLRNNSSLHIGIQKNVDSIPTNVEELKDILRGISSNILGEEFLLK